MSSLGILPFVAAQAKKQTFVGALDFKMDLAATSQPSNAPSCVEQKLLTVKDTLELSCHTISSLPWAKSSHKTSLLASKANKLQILSTPQSLREN